MKATNLSAPIGRVLFGIFVAILCGFHIDATAATPQVGGSGPPFSVGTAGGPSSDRPACRAIGVNYFDIFRRLLKNPGNTSVDREFGVLAEHHIPFVRFMATGFWPSELRLYIDNPQRYFHLMDQLIQAAERNHIGLIPDLFWNYGVVPDLMGEAASAWGNPQSKTIDFMRRYVTDMVTRYSGSSAIWAWEFGNELNLHIDLPISAHQRPMLNPREGTPTFRGMRDDLTLEDARVALREFVSAVRRVDASRPISSGNGLPRPHAFNSSQGHWWNADTRTEFGEALLAQNPDGIDLVSVHLYPPSNHKYFKGENADYATLLQEIAQVSGSAGKAVFVGEFGVSERAGGRAPQEFEALLNAIEQSNISFAALWVYDFKFQDDTYNVTFTNSRSYQLQAIEQANLTFQQQNRLCQ